MADKENTNYSFHTELKILRKTLTPFLPYLKNWLDEFRELTKAEIKLLEKITEKNFVLDRRNEIAQSYSVEFVIRVNAKLKRLWPEYQNWIRGKFSKYFMSIVGFSNFELKCKIPFSSLAIDSKIKMALQNLEVQNANELFIADGERKWRTLHNFRRLQLVIKNLEELEVSNGKPNQQKNKNPTVIQKKSSLLSFNVGQ